MSQPSVVLHYVRGMQFTETHFITYNRESQLFVVDTDITQYYEELRTLRETFVPERLLDCISYITNNIAYLDEVYRCSLNFIDNIYWTGHIQNQGRILFNVSYSVSEDVMNSIYEKCLSLLQIISA